MQRYDALVKLFDNASHPMIHIIAENSRQMKRLNVLAMVLTLTVSVQAADWSNWRGPNYNGSTDETNLPTRWSQTENVAWSIDLPGPSASTPVVWDDCVFVSTTDTTADRLWAMCIDRKSGKTRWRHEVGSGIGKDYRSTFAAPSPVTDGSTVVFFYGNGELLAYDLDGQKKWSQNIGPFAFGWTFSTSPVLFEGKLYLQILQRNVPVKGRGRPGKNESYLLALAPETGKELWRSPRDSKAVAESLEAFTTPTPFEFNGRKELLVAGGDALSGHDLETGKELWRWGTWNPGRIPHWRLVPSPVAAEGVVIVCAPKGDPVYALPAGESGTLSNDSLVWVSRGSREITSDVPTPAVYDGDFFILHGKQGNGHLSRVDPGSGEAKWTIETPGRAKYEASPTAADGKIYVMNFDGQVSVVDAQNGKIFDTIEMETASDLANEEIRDRSSIVASHGQLLIRTYSKLWCIGK